MPNLVPDWCRHGCPPPEGHRCDARYVLLGEAPGKREDEQRKPFIGPTGALQEQWWEPLGLRRSDFYITNVYPYRPTANKIETVPRERLSFWTDRLHERLAALADPFVIVPTGNTGLHSLFGDGRRISDWRGSVLAYRDLTGRQLKVIPTFHTAATFRQPILTRFCLADWSRIATDGGFKELAIPARRVIAEPSFDEFNAFVAGLSEHLRNGGPSAALAVDIETVKETNELLCVGYSYDGTNAIVLPLTRRALNGYNLDRMWDYAAQLNSHPAPKVLQNGLFDSWHLHLAEIPLVNYQWDLMEMDHCLNPNDGGDPASGGEDAIGGEQYRVSMKSLAVLTSLYTRQPFYKAMNRGKEFNWGNLYRYNGLDACVTAEIEGVLYAKLLAAGRV